MHVNFESVREEDFYDIQLDVDGCRDIYESFRQYTRRELLEGANQYDAGEGLGKQDAEKGLAFSQLPPILTIHLKRFQFDMRKMGFSKIHDYFAFPLHLNMAEFLANRNSNGDSADSNSRYSLHSVLVHSVFGTIIF